MMTSPGTPTCQYVIFVDIDFKGKFLCVDKMLGTDITVKIIRTLCNFRNMDKIYTLILVSMDL